MLTLWFGGEGTISLRRVARCLADREGRMTIDTTLVRIAADWDCSNVVRQTPGASGLWDSIRFTTEQTSECDYLVMFNNRRLAPIEVRCPPQHVWCIIQEPYIPALYDWMIEGHEAFARVFTHHIPSGPSEDEKIDKYVRSYPILPWGVDLSYDELVRTPVPYKTRGASWIASRLSLLPGHRSRNALREFLSVRRPLSVDIFGRGIRYIKNKWDALAPYRYSLAIENSRSRDYWTEKVADCFLSWTLPLYDGCLNLEDYFDPASFIRIDADDHDATLHRIEELSRSDEWERRMPAIEESRRRVLEEYQLFPALARTVRTYGSILHEREVVRIAAYRANRWKHRARYLKKSIHQGSFGDLLPVVTSKLRYVRWFGDPRVNP
jgi:hypothetical protein